MEKEKYGVHQSHCCRLHGCKYGDEDCPVVSGEIKQDYPCEDCDNECEYNYIAKELYGTLINLLQYLSHSSNGAHVVQIKEAVQKCLAVAEAESILKKYEIIFGNKK